MKKTNSIILLILIISALTIVSCGENSSNTPRESVDLQYFSKEDVARYTISSLMGQPSKSLKVQNKNELYVVSYTRKSDSQKFSYKIKFDGNKILWASEEGRWRDGQDDERISFEERDNKLFITLGYSDNSSEVKGFSKGD
jgi:hypothetical protein